MKTCCVEGCNEPCILNRRYCEYHFKLRKQEQNHNRYIRGYIPPIKEYKCIICGDIIKSRNKRKYCDRCVKARYIQVDTNSYVSMKENGKKIEEHRNIAKNLGILVSGYKDVVHHLNGDKQDNNRHNLIVLSRSNHGKLHAYINEQLLKGSTKSIEVMSWEFINNNAIPHFHCSDNPEDFEIK